MRETKMEGFEGMNEELKEEVTASEVEEIKEAEVKQKRKFGDNWLVLGVKSVVAVFAGQFIFSYLFQLIMVVVCLAQGTDLTELFNRMAHLSFFDEPWINCAVSYGMFLGIWIVMPLLFLIPKNRPIFKAIGTFSKGNNWKKFLLGILLGGGMNALCFFCANLHGDVKVSFEHFEILPLIIIFICVFIQSSAEELVCRGYYYQRLRKSYKNPAVAIFVNSSLFGALHLMNSGVTVLSILNVIAVGVFFTLLVYCLDSWWAAAAAHAAWNYSQAVVFGLPNSGSPATYSIMNFDMDSAKNSFFYDTGFGIEGSFMSLLVIVVASAILYLIYKKNPKPATDIWQQN